MEQIGYGFFHRTCELLVNTHGKKNRHYAILMGLKVFISTLDNTRHSDDLRENFFERMFYDSSQA